MGKSHGLDHRRLLRPYAKILDSISMSLPESADDVQRNAQPHMPRTRRRPTPTLGRKERELARDYLHLLLVSPLLCKTAQSDCLDSFILLLWGPGVIHALNMPVFTPPRN